MQWDNAAYELAAEIYFGGATLKRTIEEMIGHFPDLDDIGPRQLRWQLVKNYPERRAARLAAEEAEGEKRAANIRRLLAEGHTWQYISKELNVSFGTIGKYRVNASGKANVHTFHFNDRPLDLSLEGPEVVIGKLFADLGAKDCRFSIGKDEAGGYRFCGEPVEPDKSYCRQHCQKCRGTQVDRLMMYRAARSGDRMLEKTHVYGTFDRISSSHNANDPFGIRASGGQVSRLQLS